MDRTHIRAAVADDAPALAALRWEFRSARGDAPVEKREAFVGRCEDWMARELAGGSWRAWVAEQSGRIVGQVWMYAIPKIPNPIAERERHAYVSNLYVTPASRGGVGARLLEAALAHAVADGVDRVLLWPSARSRSLYLRYGFITDGGVMEKICS